MVFAAHIREKDAKVQTVAEHCKNVSEIARKFGRRIGIGSICEISGLLHDIGKLINKFNDYIHGYSSCRRGEIDHSFACAKYIRSLTETKNDKPLNYVGRFIGRVILSHHGLKDWVDAEGTDNFSRLTEKSDNYDEILNNLSSFPELKITDEMLANAAKEYKNIKSIIVGITKYIPQKRQAKACAFYMGMFERMSILIDVDRIDTADFMSDEKTEREYDFDAIIVSMEKQMNERLGKFDGFSDSISEWRKNISERCKNAAENPFEITKLIVPAGGGKTLSSLRFAIEYCKRHGKERIFYTAPFLSVLEQNAEELRKIAGEENFLEHHSNYASRIADDSEHKELRENELHEYELRSEKWDSPVIATTMVQLLNALFSGKTTDVRRMHRLAGSVIIIDEVQSLPIKCVYIFDLAMNFLSSVCGASRRHHGSLQNLLVGTRLPHSQNKLREDTPLCKDKAQRRDKAAFLL